MQTQRMNQTNRVLISIAAEAIAEADAVLFTAGAGMGVDSGLPDFRSDNGFWKAYPPLEKLNINFVEMANPRLFQVDPHLAWAFYGHRFNLYNKTRNASQRCATASSTPPTSTGRMSPQASILTP